NDEIELLNVDDEEWWIDDGVLQDCKITDCEEIRIPDGVIEIGDYPFDSFDIKRIYMPKSVTKVRESGFSFCPNLQEIYIANKGIILENKCFCDLENLESVYIGGQKFKVIVTQGSYGTEDDLGNCLERYLGEDERYVVDDDIKKLGESSFCNCSTLREVAIPQSVVEIDDKAFLNCKALTQVELPDSLEIIGWRAFEGCKAISELKIPQSVYHIRERAFDGWKSNQTIYVPLYFKKLKFLQKWRKACKATIIYY
ncbi:MAG: leucine-rich repeat domain-containing protein, partial [Clostridia bacterium]|nr:leucine-rich repeat domain-containing protein [Clostridia bacterium]